MSFRPGPIQNSSTTSFADSPSSSHPMATSFNGYHSRGDNFNPERPPRTPSPTPSDVVELNKGAIDWKHLLNWRTWAQKKYTWYYVAIVLSGILVALLSIYHKQIVDALTPTAQYLKKLPGGWAIPIGIMFVLSFPPLFGNEIVHVLCGIVWGLWIGFGIVCAGTFIGEVGNFYAFRYICQARGEKLERTNLSYGCLAKVVRDGGFLVALIARLSAIPGHFTTAVFSTCGMGIFTFCLGAFLSLPKQFATVYIGVVLYQSAGVQTTRQRLISAGVLSISLLVTIFAAWWILDRMNKAKPAVLASRRKVRAFDEWSKSRSVMTVNTTPFDGGSSYKMSTFNTASSTTLAPQFDKPFNYSGSSVNLPLSVKPQKWDANGRAIMDTDFHGGRDEENQRGPLTPDIRVIRASGASSLAGQTNPYYAQAQEQAQGRGYDTASRPTGTFPPGPSSSQPPRPSSDEGSNESGPQWKAGVSREDDKDVKIPLTAGMKRSDSTPFQPPQHSHPAVMSPSVSAPSAVRYDDPYEDAYGGHTWEPTDATFHTAQGSEDVLGTEKGQEWQRKQAQIQQQQHQQQEQYQQQYAAQQQQMQQQQMQQRAAQQYAAQQQQQQHPNQMQQHPGQPPNSPQHYPNPPQQNPNPHQQDPAAASSVNVVGSYPQSYGR